MKSNKHLPFWLITIAACIVVLIAQINQYGMFNDGLMYACVARNLAFGIGKFWNLSYTETVFMHFREQPPLAFYIQSIFFKLIGDHLYTEKIYCVLSALATAFFMVKIWKLIFKDDLKLSQLSWIPTFFWITTPIVFWTYSNNMIESTMCIFDLGAIYFLLKVVEFGEMQDETHLKLMHEKGSLNFRKPLVLSALFFLNKQNKKIGYLFIASLLIFMASLCKGFQGLFPLMTVVIFWLFTKQFSIFKMIRWSVILLSCSVIGYLALLQNETIYSYYKEYFASRLVTTFQSHVHDTTQDRFYLLWRLLTELSPIIIISILFYVYCRLTKKTTHFIPGSMRYSYVLMAVGMCGALPLMVTTEQRAFYLTTSIPFLILGISIIAVQLIKNSFIMRYANYINNKIYLIASIVVLLSAVTYASLQTNSFRRDENKLQDIWLLQKNIPSHTIIKVTESLWNDFTLHSYFMRLSYISLDMDNNEHTYFLCEKNNKVDLNVWNKIPLHTISYDLYAKK